MKVYIYSNYTNNYIDYTKSITSEIKTDERLDEVLDSGSFTMLVGYPNSAIEPFTRLIIEHDDGKQVPFFATSTCNKYLTKKNLYYHEVQLYEPTKIMECWILGTKAFSIIQGKENYNSNYDRIRIICELMSDKYNVQINLDDKIKSMLKEREYCFGAGTTAWDAIYEVMKTENCIPRISFSMYDSQNTFILSFDKPHASIDYQKFTSPTKVLSNNNVDEYCSEMEAEYSEVVDRDTLQECMLSCRGPSDVISRDNACLITPSPIENLESLKIQLNGTYNRPAVKIILLPKNEVDDVLNVTGFNAAMSGNGGTHHGKNLFIPFLEDNEKYRQFLGVLNEKYPQTYRGLKFFLNNICEVDDSYINDTGNINNATDDVFLYIVKDENITIHSNIQNYHKNYYLCCFYDFLSIYHNKARYSIDIDKIDLTPFILPKERWDMLSAKDRTKYLSWKSGECYINEFNNKYNDSFFESIIYGDSGPFLVEFKNAFANYDSISKYAAQCYWNEFSNRLKEVKYIDQLPYLEANVLDYDSYNPHLNNDVGGNYDFISGVIHTDFINHVYEVKYHSKSPTFVRTEKETMICQTVASKSFNSGASTIDFNQLAPAIQRAVDMQGLENTTIYAKDDFEVGSRTEYGYIISKSSTYKLIDNGGLLKSFVYNCCNNYQQVAAVIGVDSQYEATNIPQSGIVSRFLYDEIDDVIIKDKFYLGIKMKSDDSDWIAKPLQMLETEGQRLFVCQTIDNYVFDTQKTDSDAENYYLNKIVGYSDSDAYQIKYADVAIITINDYSLGTLNYLPLISTDKVNVVTKVFKNKNIYKDPRERLIFVLKHTGSLLK